MRKSIFNETHTEIVKHNSQKGASFEMAHNAFSVMVIAFQLFNSLKGIG
jgi:hypothetical protein